VERALSPRSTEADKQRRAEREKKVLVRTPTTLTERKSQTTRDEGRERRAKEENCCFLFFFHCPRKTTVPRRKSRKGESLFVVASPISSLDEILEGGRRDFDF